AVKTNAPIDARYEKKTSTSGSPYFVLKAGNHEVIGTSQMYTSTASRDDGIEAVKRTAPSAPTTDLLRLL
ncbi:MAG: YegP family protein, partial [Nannocystales bacterium]